MPRAWLALAGGLLSLALVGSLVVAPDGEPDARPVPPAVVDLALVERGWRLGDDGAPPVGVDGMRLTDSVELDYRQRAGQLRLGPGWRTDGTRYAVLWCDLPVIDDPAVRPPALSLTFDEGTVTVPCAGRRGSPALTSLQPLPPAGPDDRPRPEHEWTGDLPEQGTATLAVYVELYGAPLRAGAPEPPPAPPPGAAGVDSTDPAARHGRRTVHVTMVALQPSSRLLLWAGGPGLLQVSVDGTVVTDDGDLDPGSSDWTGQDPDLRNGYWRAPRTGSSRTLDLPAQVLPPTGGSRTVVVSVPGARALPRSWSVHVVPGEHVAPQGAARAVPPPDLPDVAGYRPEAAWEVPRDGHPHELPLPASSGTGGPRAGGREGDDGPWSWSYVVVTQVPEDEPTAVLASTARSRRIPGLTAEDLADGGQVLVDALRRPILDPGPETAGPALAVTLPPAPGQPAALVLAWRKDRGG